MSAILLRSSVAISLLLLTSCGTTIKLPPMAPVSGKVTLDGQPVTRGMVQFSPDNSKGTQGTSSTGAIGPDGSYTLSVQDGGPGAMIGWHKVAVSARAEPKNEMDTAPKELVPLRYFNPTSSGLTFEVKGGQSNEINLELKSAP